jgi:hypothetical protein
MEIRLANLNQILRKIYCCIQNNTPAAPETKFV